jgi:diamine N-acetyltransferase
MTKNVTLRRPKLLDLDQLLLWENNLENSLYSDNPIFYTIEQIEEFLTSDQDIFLDRKIRFMIDSSGSSVGCVDLFEYDMVNSRAGVGIFIDEKFRNMGIGTKALSLLKSICFKDYFISNLHTNILYNNKASIKLFERAGFTKNGIKENWIRTENSMLDVWFFQCFLKA